MMAVWRLIGRPAAPTLALALGLSGLAAIFGVALLGLSGWFLTAAASAGLSGASYLFNHLYPSAGVRAFAVGRVLARYAEQVIGHDATLKISAAIRPLLFERLARSRQGLVPVPAGELAALVDDVSALEGGFLRVVSPTFAVAAGVCVALGWTLAVSPLLAVCVAAAFLLSCFLLPAALLSRRRRQAIGLAEEQASVRSEIAGVAENAVELDIAGALHAASSNAISKLARADENKDRMQAPFRAASTAISFAGGLSAMIVLASAIATGSDGAVATGATLAILAAFEAAAASARILDAAASASASAKRLQDRLAPKVSGGEEAVVVKSALPLELRGVRVAIDNRVMIAPLSLSCVAGDIIAVCGRSGIGKSTLLETIAALRLAGDGLLTYGGVSQASARPASVLARIAIAPQFPAFLPGALREQLAYGRPDASEDDIVRALAIVEMDKALTAPRQMDAGAFSGGERRRLGVARALLAEPEILLLDEPFTGLEDELAERLRANLARWVSEGRRAVVFTGHEAGPDWGAIQPRSFRLER